MSSAAPIVDIGDLIWVDPEGHACLRGRKLAVWRIVELSREPLTPEEIAIDVLGLDIVSVAEVYAALAFYHANRALVDDEIAELQRAYEDLGQDPRITRPPTQ